MKIDEIFKQSQIDKLKSQMIGIYKKRNTPPTGNLLSVVKKANAALNFENEEIRSYDISNKPGGIIYLKQDIPTIIVPDLHARVKFLINLLSITDIEGYSILEKMAFNKLQVVCVGDGFHSEYGTRERWKAAYNEFTAGFHHSKNMHSEMANSLRLMEIVQILKSTFPDNFHFLKGNHENICNERENGNHAFRKFAWESMMVYDYMQKFYSSDLLQEYYNFEKNLPLLAVGNKFVISHAEPLTFYNKDKIVNYRYNPDVIEGLTWTADDDSEEGSVDKMLKQFLKDTNGSYYFGGHRSIKNLYNLRAGGKFVQIHNPAKYAIAFLDNKKEINLDQDIFVLDNNLNNTFTMKSFIKQKVVRNIFGTKLRKKK